MMQAPPYTITNSSVTVVWQGKPITVQQGSPNFQPLRSAIVDERWDDIANHLTIGKSLSEWTKGKFSANGNQVLFEGKEIPQSLNQRIAQMASRGEDPTPVFKFWERLAANPSWRSVHQLWPFLQHQGIPLTEDGHFLAYKGVRSDLKDAHSGTIDNTPGKIIEMPRNEISDDPQTPCHEGLHVGARGYASTFHSGGKLLICKVDPRDVVCIPYDSGAQKMRVCRYEVIGFDNGSHMPSTTMSNATIGTTYVGSDQEDDDDYRDKVGSEYDAGEPDWESSTAPDDDGDEEESDSWDHKHPENDLNITLSLTEDEKQMLDEAGNVIGVIKKIRDRRHGTGLKEAKNAVDAYLMSQGMRPPVGKVVDLMEPKDDGYIISEPKRKAKKGYAKLDKLDFDGLMQRSLEDLREYAGKGLSIVGASKIPGGKSALVARILEVRA